MLPADLDDEQRAHLAHKHPTDLDSGPSSPSSGLPPFFESPRRPKSASRHRSHTATDGSTSSSHLLARLVSREEEVRELNAALVVTTERLEGESSRANAAERRALDYFHRLRIATENRERADQESARLREELKLYKLQLENAQKEIFRAQDIIDQVASQRNEAEAEAAKARTKARKLQEEKLVMLAREEGRRMGYREGLSIGRRIGYDEEDRDGDEDAREHEESTTDEERNDPRSYAQLRSAGSIRQPPMRSESAPPIRSPESALHVPPLPVLVHTPSHGRRTPSLPREPDEPETIHPIPIRPSPIISSQQIGTPPDGWIPRADSRTSYIHVPRPHELQKPVPSSPSSVGTEIQDARATSPPQPMPVPPPVRARDYAYQVSVPAPIQPVRTSSLASRTSTHISQYDIVKKRPGSSLRNEIYAGIPRSGSQQSRESTSRNSHRDQDDRHSTEAKSIVEQWRADAEATPPSRNPPRSLTPGAVAPPRRPAHFYYRPRTATPLGDIETDPRSGTPGPVESTATPPPNEPASHARARTPLSYLRQRFRQRPSSGSTIPNIIVESPSEPETHLSPSVTIAAQPDLLSPEAANRPLPQDDAHQHPQPSQSYYQSQSQPQHRDRDHDHDHYHHRHHDPRDRAPSSTYDAGQRSYTPTPSGWPAGFIPYAPGRPESTKPGTRQDREREREREREGQRRAYAYADPPSSSRSQHTRTGSNTGYYTPAQQQPPPAYTPDGYARTRTRSASSTYEAAPLPPGVTYPTPPMRPHTSHRHSREHDREGERNGGGRDRRDLGWDLERDRERERNRERVRDRDRDRDRRRDSGRDRDRDRDGDRDRERDLDDALDEELTRSPAPLARPISLFDSDEA